MGKTNWTIFWDTNFAILQLSEILKKMEADLRKIMNGVCELIIAYPLANSEVLNFQLCATRFFDFLEERHFRFSY